MALERVVGFNRTLFPGPLDEARRWIFDPIYVRATNGLDKPPVLKLVEISLAQVGPGERSRFNIRPVQSGPGKVGVIPAGASQPGFAQVGVPEIGPVQVRIVEPGAPKIRVPQIRAGKINSH